MSVTSYPEAMSFGLLHDDQVRKPIRIGQKLGARAGEDDLSPAENHRAFGDFQRQPGGLLDGVATFQRVSHGPLVGLRPLHGLHLAHHDAMHALPDGLAAAEVRERREPLLDLGLGDIAGAHTRHTLLPRQIAVLDGTIHSLPLLRPEPLFGESSRSTLGRQTDGGYTRSLNSLPSRPSGRTRSTTMMITKASVFLNWMVK